MRTPTAILLLAALVATLATARPALPTPVPAREGTVRVGMLVNPPWIYHDADCRLRGIAYENLERLSARSGVRFEYVPVASSVGEPELLAAGIGMAVAHPRFNGAFRRMVEQPFGFEINTVILGRGLVGGRLPPMGPRVRIGVRNIHVVREYGLEGARLLQHEDFAMLAEAYRRGEVDLLVGHRESLRFALLRSGVPARELQENTLPGGSFFFPFFLSPEVEADFGERLRRAAIAMDWSRSELQLRDRYLTAQAAQDLAPPGACEGRPTGEGGLRPSARP